MSGEDFFSFHGKMNRSKRQPAAVNASLGQAAMTPSQLNKLIEATLKAHLPATVLLKGEVSNFTRNRNSGHLYFTLKDSAGAIDAIMWASRAERLRFEPRDGMELLASGAIGVYVPRGRYQIVVNSLDPVGEGALELAKRQLEQKLRGEGLFEPDRKRPIPAYPRTVAIITSPQAAGFADVLKVLRRCAWLRLLIDPVPVQGRDAAPAVANAIQRLSKRHRDLGQIDVALVIRGGGSLEDLWAFNEEVVARAIAGSSIPIITGIGHDIDVSIADLVADHHAHTPTEAASYVIRQWIHASDEVSAIESHMLRELRRRIASGNQQLISIARHEVFRRPTMMLDTPRQQLDEIEHDLSRQFAIRRAAALQRIERAAGALSPTLIRRSVSRGHERLATLANSLGRALTSRIEQSKRSLDAMAAQLRALSPEHVLKRGYSITRLKKTGEVVRHTDQIKGGELLEIRVADGNIESRATDPKQAELF